MAGREYTTIEDEAMNKLELGSETFDVAEFLEEGFSIKAYIKDDNPNLAEFWASHHHHIPLQTCIHWSGKTVEGESFAAGIEFEQDKYIALVLYWRGSWSSRLAGQGEADRCE